MNNDTRLVIRICLSLLSVLLILYKCTQRDKQFDHIQKEAEQSIQQQSQQALQTPSPQQLEQLQQQSQSIWTPAAEKTLYDSIYAGARKFKVDDNARVAFAECCVSRIKQLFPSGVDIGKVPDSVKRTMSKIMSECAQNFQGHITSWPKENLRQLKLQLYSFAEAKALPKEGKQDFVDCLADKITMRFPSGLGKAKDSLKTFITKARIDCFKLVIAKVDSSKH